MKTITYFPAITVLVFCLSFMPEQAQAWTGDILQLNGATITGCSTFSGCSVSGSTSYNAPGYSDLRVRFTWSTGGSCLGSQDGVTLKNGSTTLWGVASGCSGYPAAGTYNISAGTASSGTIVFTIRNGFLHSGTWTISSAYLVGTDNAPTISSIAAQSVNENSSISNIAFTIGDDVTAATSLTVSATSSNTTLVPNANITLGGSGTSRTLSITPATNTSGTSNITVTVTDERSQSTSVTFTLTVNFVNAAPSFTKGANQTVNENSGAQSVANWATSINKGKSDESGQTITFTTSNNNNSLFSAQPSVSSAGTLTYTPANCAYGSATVSVYATDDGGTANGGSNTSATQTFTINVNNVNYPPTIDAISDVTIPWYRASEIPMSGISKGTCGGTITVTASSGAPSVIASPSVSYTSPNTTGTLTLTPVLPATQRTASSLITITVNDGVNTPVTETFTANALWVSRLFR